MGQRFFPDSVGALTQASNVISLAPSALTIGGQQYVTTSAVTYTATGLTASTKYNLFAVVTGGVVSITASTNSITTGPGGYAAFLFIRSFVTSSAGAFGSFAGAYEDPNPVGTIIHSMLTLAQFQSIYGTNWVLADGASVAGSMYALITGNTTIPDARGLFLRAAGSNGTPIGGITYNGGSLGSAVGDQIQNLTGSFQTQRAVVLNYSGGFAEGSPNGATGNTTSGGDVGRTVTFDASRVARTGTETHPANLAVNVFIKINM